MISSIIGFILVVWLVKRTYNMKTMTAALLFTIIAVVGMAFIAMVILGI